MIPMNNALLATASMEMTQTGVTVRSDFLLDDLKGVTWETLLAALNHPDLPAMGSHHPEVPNARLIKRRSYFKGQVAAVELTWLIPG